MAFKYQLQEDLDLQASYEGFMDILKSMANKIKDGFSTTLKKITDITTRGVSAAQSSDWNHVLGKVNPICNENNRILTFKQAMDLMTKSVPVIIEDTKKVVLVYNQTKPADELPKQEELDKIKEDIDKYTDETVCDGQPWGPNFSGNSGCNWSSTNTRQFISIYLKTTKTGLPQDVIKLTAEDRQQEETPEGVKAINEVRWLVKAYGKCIAETSKTVVKLSDTCGQREDSNNPTPEQSYVS